MFRRPDLSTPSGLDRYRTGSDPLRNRTPWCWLGKKPLPQRREKIGWSVLFPLPWEIWTTNAGRFWLRLPIPYDSQAPRLGRPGCCDPVWMYVIAGSWLIASVFSDFTTAISSAMVAMFGSKSLTQVPALPC